MTYEPLSERHESIIRKLLSAEFPGREAVRDQIASSRARLIDQNGSLEFQIQTDQLAATDFRVPVEGEFEDVDGITIHVLLHVVGGRVQEMEIYKDDSSDVVEMPSPDKLRIFVPQG